MIYFDNAATTECYKETLKLQYDYNSKYYFNPSALYKQSSEVASHIKEARNYLKGLLHAADEDELYFLSGGSEADNTALFCTKKRKGSRIIVGEGEHDAIINSANQLKSQGYDVQFAPINPDGSVNIKEFKALLNEDTSLVSIMHVSNETGVINDIEKLVKLTRKLAPNAYFHSDGVQAFCKTDVNLRKLDVDLYSISAHKIHGPKGIGALYVKKGVSIKPLIFGGGQEKGFRAGTESAPMMISFAHAASVSTKNFNEVYSKNKQILEYIKGFIKENIPDTVILTPEEKSVSNILTVAFKDLRGEVLLHTLENYDILVGIGSACSSHHESRFKKLLNLDDRHKDGIIRFSFSDFNTMEQAEYVAKILKEEVEKLQQYTRI